MDHGRSERDAGVGTRWSDFGLAPDAKKPHNQRDAWWRLAAVFILICRIKCWIYEAVRILWDTVKQGTVGKLLDEYGVRVLIRSPNCIDAFRGVW